jgi:hypothetical protein
MSQSRPYTAGLCICALLAVADLIGLIGLNAADAPPVPVTVMSAVLGLMTLVVLRPAWRGEARGLTTVLITRVLSALLGVPAFFVDSAPAWAGPLVAASLALTAVAVALLLRGRAGFSSVSA